MAGEKTVTRRLVSSNPRSPWWKQRCSLQPGRTYAVCPGRGKNAIGRVLVTDVHRDVWFGAAALAPEEVRREGFESAEEFDTALARINGKVPIGAVLWRIEFERAEAER